MVAASPRLEVTLTGTDFVQGATSAGFSGTGVVVLSVSVSSDTMLTALLALSGAPGVRNVTVTTASGTSSPATFTINSTPLTGFAALASTTFAGGFPGTANGTGTEAKFNASELMWGDGTNLYVLDNGALRQIVSATGEVTTIALSGRPKSSLWGNSTTLYFTTDASIIEKLDLATGQITTLAGTSLNAGSTDGTGSAALFNDPGGIAGDGLNLYVADRGNRTIRKIVIATGQVTTLAGSPGAFGSTDGVCSAALFNAPTAVWGDGEDLYVADIVTRHVRRIRLSTAEVTTVAGGAISGFVDGIGSGTLFDSPAGVWGNGTNLFVADRGNRDIRKLSGVSQQALATGVSPTFGDAGAQNLPFTMVGTNLGNVTGLKFQINAGDTQAVQVSTVVAQANQVTARLDIDSGATQGMRKLVLITPGGDIVSDQVFQVDPRPAVGTVSGISPSSSVVGQQGIAIRIVYTANDLSAATGLEFQLGGSADNNLQITNVNS